MVHLPKGSPEAKAYMAFLRSMRGKKRRGGKRKRLMGGKYTQLMRPPMPLGSYPLPPPRPSLLYRKTRYPIARGGAEPDEIPPPPPFDAPDPPPPPPAEEEPKKKKKETKKSKKGTEQIADYLEMAQKAGLLDSGKASEAAEFMKGPIGEYLINPAVDFWKGYFGQSKDYNDNLRERIAYYEDEIKKLKKMSKKDRLAYGEKKRDETAAKLSKSTVGKRLLLARENLPDRLFKRLREQREEIPPPPPEEDDDEIPPPPPYEEDDEIPPPPPEEEYDEDYMDDDDDEPPPLPPRVVYESPYTILAQPIGQPPPAPPPPAPVRPKPVVTDERHKLNDQIHQGLKLKDHTQRPIAPRPIAPKHQTTSTDNLGDALVKHLQTRRPSLQDSDDEDDDDDEWGDGMIRGGKMNRLTKDILLGPVGWVNAGTRKRLENRAAALAREYYSLMGWKV